MFELVEGTELSVPVQCDYIVVHEHHFFETEIICEKYFSIYFLAV